MSDLSILFREHLDERIKQTAKVLAVFGYRSLILGAGEPFTYFCDDSQPHFKPNPHFSHWCPALGPHHLIKYEVGRKPLLAYYSPDDYWHAHHKLDSPFWAECFEIVEAATVEGLWQALGETRSSVFIGNETRIPAARDLVINCPFVTARLNWYRRYKSAYEVACLSRANQIASVAHRAAKAAFFQGASEYEMHMAYLQATQSVESEMPYSGIVALNQNGSTLHYHGREKSRNGLTALVDCGALYNHYVADVTRTYARSDCHPVFMALLAEMEQIQTTLCAAVRPGVRFSTLHLNCHLEIAKALQKVGILKVSGEDPRVLVEQGLTKPFFPHGLGHLLGVQTHDVGGKQLDVQGNPVLIHPEDLLSPSLRFVGTLEDGVVVTIEPGLYFIPTLLNDLRQNNPHAGCIDWDLVQQLVPCGGIRIEDDVLTTAGTPRNLTREFLPG